MWKIKIEKKRKIKIGGSLGREGSGLFSFALFRSFLSFARKFLSSKVYLSNVTFPAIKPSHFPPIRNKFQRNSNNFFPLILTQLHTARMIGKAEIPSLLNWESFIFMITDPMHKLLMSPPSHHILSTGVTRNTMTSHWSSWSHLLDLMSMFVPHALQLVGALRSHGTKWLLPVLEKPNTVSAWGL